jgi:hypothetical protein
LGSQGIGRISYTPCFANVKTRRANADFIDEIRSQESEVGTLVSVSIETAVDGGGTAFTLALPRVNLDDSQNFDISTPVSALGITASDLSKNSAALRLKSGIPCARSASHFDVRSSAFRRSRAGKTG